jgi:hypothetical protein
VGACRCDEHNRERRQFQVRFHAPLNLNARLSGATAGRPVPLSLSRSRVRGCIELLTGLDFFHSSSNHSPGRGFYSLRQLFAKRRHRSLTPRPRACAVREHRRVDRAVPPRTRIETYPTLRGGGIRQGFAATTDAA